MNKKVEENYLLINVKKEETFQQEREDYVKEIKGPLLIENDRPKSDISEHNIKQEICEVEEEENIHDQDENSGNDINVCYVKEEILEVEVKGESANIYSESECIQSDFNEYYMNEQRLEKQVQIEEVINNEDIHDKSKCAQIEEDNVQNNYIQLTTVRTCAGCISGDNVDLSHHTDDVLFGTIQANTKQLGKQQPDMLYHCNNVCDWNSVGDERVTLTTVARDKILDLTPLASYSVSDIIDDVDKDSVGLKTWTQEDMDLALDALRSRSMSLAKASSYYRIPSTTLWQRAHRVGIDTPKNGSPGRSWTNEALRDCLEALHSGSMSANKASKAYGIPSSTLYKIAKREGIKLAPPFNAAPTTWTRKALNLALEAIRSGQVSVQKASTEFGIPTGTLYGRCKREGIELSRSTPPPWSEDIMGEALEAVKVGQMSINQASVHYKLPYSSLYGRFKRGSSETNRHNSSQVTHFSPPLFNSW